MKRKRFDVMDSHGATLYPLHGVAIRAAQGLVELLDINTNGHPTDLYTIRAAQGLVELLDINTNGHPTDLYTKAIIALGASESVVEVAYEVPS
jgi:hypothetical protein